MKPFVLTIAFSFVLATASVSLADAPLEGTKPAHWRLTWTTDPGTTATVSWSTKEIGSKHTLRFRIKGDDQDKTVSTALARSGRFTGGQEELYYHHVQLTDLTPGTAYEVQMNSDDQQSAWFYFVTAPENDRDFSILNGGDSRSDRPARRQVNKMIAKMVSESFANDDDADDILALAHGGDYIVSGKNVGLWSKWLSDYELCVSDDGRLLPIIPARGNHDSGKPFNEVFGLPDDDTNYYAIDIGPEVRFVTLNTEISVAGDQAKWIDKELQQSRKDNRWLVAQYHRPIYPAVKSPSRALKVWAPLFDEHNVDLVCESDGHNIKRTFPIRNNKRDPTGVVYIGEGGLGVDQRTPKTDRWFLQSPGMADRGHHVFVLTFGQKELAGSCVLLDGSVRDQFTRPVRSLTH